MNNGPECLPCCLRRVLHCCDQLTADDWLRRKVLAEAMGSLSRADELATPAELAFGVIHRASKTLGDADPYAADKASWIEKTQACAGELRALIEGSTDPMLMATRLAGTANLVGFEFRDELPGGFGLKSLLRAAKAGELALASEVFEDFRSAVDAAERILFVHESAGELVFDRMMIEASGKSSAVWTSVVRSGPIGSDATRADAESAGLAAIVGAIIDPGTPCRGVPLAASSQAFRETFAAADVVLAKGQAAYQTLEGGSAGSTGNGPAVFFLLRVRCALMARQLGVRIGDVVLEAD